jgi:ribosome-associated protein
MSLIEFTSELIFSTSRSGGKGGQNVNKVETKVEVRWDIDGSQIANTAQKEMIKQKLSSRLNSKNELIITASEHRTQLANKIAVIKKIHQIVHQALRIDKKRIKTDLPSGAKLKRREAKKRNSELKKSRSGKFED